MSKLTTIDDIAVRKETDKAYGIADGTEEDYRGQVREKLFWIPKALDGVELSDDRTSIIVPTWKAEEVGLI